MLCVQRDLIKVAPAWGDILIIHLHTHSETLIQCVVSSLIAFRGALLGSACSLPQQFANRTVYDEKEVLHHLPPAMRVELTLHMYREVIKTTRIFEDLSNDAVSDLCLALEAFPALAGDPVINEESVRTVILSFFDLRSYDPNHRPLNYLQHVRVCFALQLRACK